ncbi:hypothetical protein [Gayadomonas joobiniege]|uniref:hypothetical protein n=1 Tax=Gayadomonas joobiniege TaxID=1234606 RepID=UPI0003640D14|nr:hypothetical protein [Gayadomonas joobiniege]
MFALKSVVAIAVFATFSATASPSDDTLKSSVEAELKNSVQSEINQIVTELEVSAKQLAVNFKNDVKKGPAQNAEQPVNLQTAVAE